MTYVYQDDDPEDVEQRRRESDEAFQEAMRRNDLMIVCHNGQEVVVPARELLDVVEKQWGKD